MQLEREFWCDGSDAGRVGPNADTVIAGNAIIAGAADPVETVANPVHDLLVSAYVALYIFPA